MSEWEKYKFSRHSGELQHIPATEATSLCSPIPGSIWDKLYTALKTQRVQFFPTREVAPYQGQRRITLVGTLPPMCTVQKLFARQMCREEGGGVGGRYLPYRNVWQQLCLDLCMLSVFDCLSEHTSQAPRSTHLLRKLASLLPHILKILPHILKIILTCKWEYNGGKCC